MKVIYHANCIDGFTAAWVAHLRFGDDAEYIPAQYGEAPPVVIGEDVLILDFSYPRETLLEMHNVAQSLRVLDHHKTAEASLAGLDFCTFDMNRSGAGLAWDELHGGDRSPLVDYVEDRDLWRWKLPGSKEINAWIGSFDQSFMTWGVMSRSIVNGWNDCHGIGAALLRGVDRYCREMGRQARFIEFAGHAGIPVVNAPYINTSELVGSLAEHPSGTGHALFAVGWFQRGDGKYQYSLRSRGDFDVSLVAKQYGGGGHKNAAGFTVEKLVHQ